MRATTLRAALNGWSIDADVNARTTLGRMARFVQKAILDPQIVYSANRIIAIANSRDYPGQIAAIRAFLMRRFRFVGNPLGAQAIRTPAFMLLDMAARGFTQGACDDAAVLAATLGTANAIPSRFRAIAFCHKKVDGACSPEPLSHVVADLFDGQEWIPLDVTKPYDMLRAPTIARELIYPLS